MLFQVSIERFREIVKQEKTNPNSKNVVEWEETDNSHIFYFIPLGQFKCYTCIIPKDKLTDFLKMELVGIAQQARYVNDSSELKIINESIKNLSEKIDKIPNITIPVVIDKNASI